jgi:hypothetical protein
VAFSAGAVVLRGVVEGSEGVKVSGAAARLPSSAGVWAWVPRAAGRDVWGLEPGPQGLVSNIERV